MTRLNQLHDEQGQSPWLDNLTRDHLRTGQLERLVSRGVRGVTANPTILANAIASSEAYDAQFARLVGGGATAEEAYWELVITDVVDALPHAWRIAPQKPVAPILAELPSPTEVREGWPE